MILLVAACRLYVRLTHVNRLNVYRFSNHCRTINGLSAAVQRRFKDGMSVIRRIPHYVDCNNEPFDYLEIDVDLRIEA